MEELTVTVNAVRPRRGVFEVRVGEAIVVSTGPEARPFPALKALDVNAVTKSTKDKVYAAYQSQPYGDGDEA